MRLNPAVGSDGDPVERPDAQHDHPEKPAFVPPKLTFVKPELVKEGKFTEVTGQFFGTFLPA